MKCHGKRPAAFCCAGASYHGQRHPVNLVFVFGLVLPERAVPEKGAETHKHRHQRCTPNWCARRYQTGSQLSDMPYLPPKQLEEHAPQREPVGAAVVRRPLLQNLWGHVAVGAPENTPRRNLTYETGATL